MKNTDIKIRVIRSKTEKDKEDRFKKKVKFRYLSSRIVWMTAVVIVILQCCKLLSNWPIFGPF